MKGLKIALAVLLAALVAFAVYFFVGGTLRTEVYTASTDAVEAADAFSEAVSALRSGAASEVFLDEIPDSAEGYRIVEVSITLQNRGLFAAEWLTVSVSPGPLDVAAYSMNLPASDLAPGAETTLNMRLLSRSGESARSVTIQYYVLGMKRTLTVAC